MDERNKLSKQSRQYLCEHGACRTSFGCELDRWRRWVRRWNLFDYLRPLVVPPVEGSSFEVRLLYLLSVSDFLAECTVWKQPFQLLETIVEELKCEVCV